MLKITIRKSAFAGTRLVYKGDTLIATISGEKPNRANLRAGHWGIAWVTGRFDWFDSYSEARDCALKG